MATDFLKTLLGENFKEGMTIEEISSALEKSNLKPKSEENDKEVTKLKELISKANSEAAGYKKQLREKQTEAERKAAEDKEAFEKMQQELDTLKQEKQVSDYSAKLTAQGYDSETATATAKAFMNGDLDTVLKNQKDLMDKKEALLKSELLKTTPRPESGSTGGEKMTKEKLYKMSLQDRMKFVEEHKEEYKKLMEEE